MEGLAADVSENSFISFRDLGVDNLASNVFLTNKFANPPPFGDIKMH